MPPKSTRRIPVLNVIRCAVFVLLYVQLFVLNLWLVPFFANLLVSIAILSTLPFIHYSASIRSSIERQVFDRINLGNQVVEYESGAFGDHWDRPYSEFRVHCQPMNLGFAKLYLIRLKHRVIGNSVLKATFNEATADQAVADIVNNSRLGFPRS